MGDYHRGISEPAITVSRRVRLPARRRGRRKGPRVPGRRDVYALRASRARQLAGPRPHRLQHLLDACQLVVHRAHAHLECAKPVLHPAELSLHALEAMLHACEPYLEVFEALFDAERAVVHFILAPDDGMEFVVRSDSQRSFGVALDANEDIIWMVSIGQRVGVMRSGLLG